MKNLFLALTLTAFVGAASLETVSAAAGSSISFCGGEECKKDSKCKKGSACCKAKSTATTDNKCSKDEAKKCCKSKSTASTVSNSEVKPATAPEVKQVAKPAEAEK